MPSTPSQPGHKMGAARLTSLTLPLAVLTISTIPFLLLLGTLKPMLSMQKMKTHDALTVLTLIYGQQHEHRNIEHNCVVISRTRHRYVIFTDSLSQPYCSLCECHSFTKLNCPCPDQAKGCSGKNPCEKLFFLIRAIDDFQEFVFLDNDLLILKEYFLDRLLKHALAHDFLASYGHKFVNSFSYTQNFNSGLLFIRRVQGINYEEMKDMLYERKAKQDQGIISIFIQEKYRNWDVLSWKWHCRMLKRLDRGIPLDDCYTIHDRNEVEYTLKSLNRTRLTISLRRR